MIILKSLIAGVSYSESGLKVHEGRFRDVIYILCRLTGMSVNCEMHTSHGRIDMTVETSRYIYVIEFKVDHTAENALSQIEEKHYADRYLSDSRRIVRVGVEFSSAERNIVSWTVE